MAAKSKYKRLTNKEKQFNKEFKQDMIVKGILPPPKKKLNRAKFVKETREEFNKEFNLYSDLPYLTEAFGYSIPSGTLKSSITAEEIGACKVLKLALAIKQHHEALREQGIKEYKVGEFYEEVIKPIWDM